MPQCRDEIVAWVALNIVPHERELRGWLRKIISDAESIDDIIHDAYVCIAQLKSVRHIQNARSYLFTTARMVLLQNVRRSRIVRIDSLIDIDVMAIADGDPGPERSVAAKLELMRIRRFISELPERCREIFELRRVHGVSQREIAERLGLPEHTVEAQASRGMKLLLKAMANEAQERSPEDVKIDRSTSHRHG